MDDVTLGKLLTEAHRGQADYCEPEGVSVSQSSSSVVFDRAGKPARERNVDQSLVFGVTSTVLTASFLKTPKLRIWSMDQGNPMSEIARAHRVGLFLKNRDRQLSRIVAKKSDIKNSKQLTQKKSADCYKDKYGDRNWNFVKLINKVLQRWTKITKIPVESLSRTRTLFLNYQAKYKNYKMK